MGIQFKVWAGVGLTLLVGFVLVQLDHYRAIEEVAMEEVREDARALRGLLMATRRVYHHQFLDSGLPLEDNTLGFLPAHALSRISQEFREWYGTGLSFNNVSTRARNPDNRADRHEEAAIRHFERHADATDYMSLVEGDDGKAFYLFAQPIWTEPYCLGCHGPKEGAPETIRRHYDEGFDYQDGDLRGIVSIKIPAEPVIERKYRHLWVAMRDQLAIFLLTLLVGGWLLQRLVIGKLKRVEHSALAFADGDYQARIDVAGRDEIAMLGSSFNRMADSIQERERQLSEAQAFAGMSICQYYVASGELRWSDQVTQLLGLPADSLDMERFRQLIHPLDRQRAEAHRQRCVKEGQASSYDFRLVLPDKRILWMNCRARPIVDAGGEVVRVEGFLQDVSDRKRAEMDIFEVNRRMQAAADAAHIGIWDFNIDTGALTWDAWMRRVYGVADAAKISRYEDWEKQVHPDDLERVSEEIKRSIDRQENFNTEFRILRPGGEVRYIRARGSVITEWDGDGRRLVGTNQDVTAQRTAEQALRASEERFELAMRGANDGIFDWDLRDNRIYYTPRWKSMLGYGEDELENDFSVWERLIYSEDREKSWAMLKDYIGGRRDDFNMEFRMRHKDGHWVDILSRAYLTRDDKGEPIRVVGTHLDISRRKQAERSLRRERDRAQHYLDVVGAMIIALDAQGRVSMINRWGCDILGLPEARIVGRCWFDDFLPPEIVPAVREIFGQLMQGEVEPVEFAEGDIVTASGERRTIAWHNSVLRGEGGEIVGILSSGEDVTERNRAMAALEKERGFLQNVIDGIDDPLMVVGPDYRILRANAQALRALPPDREDRDVKCHSLLHERETPCDEEDWPCPLQAVLETGEPYRVIHRHMTRDEEGRESPRTFEIVASPMHDDQGKVTGVIEASRDITDHLRLLAELKEREISYAHLAQHDGLTGLPNRVLLADRLTQAIQAARRRKLRLALLVVDIHGFKHINDSLGHYTGDELLKRVARRLGGMLRDEDTLARVGGDEFAVLLNTIARSDAAALVARKLLALFDQPLEIGTHKLSVGVSIGISVFPGPALDAGEMVRNADAALHRAKESGRNTFEYYAEEMTAHALERVMLEANLREALEHQQFVLYYQPQFEIASYRITGFEALVRWQHPEMGLVSPMRFIPLAEESGIILPLGEWILKQACRQMQCWVEAGLAASDDQMCVNLSARQFEQDGLIDQIRDTLADTGLDSACLELEITESAMMRAPERSAALLRRLRQLGVKIAIDDFGTGYSSLSYLKQLPFTKIKIDQSFVRDIPGDEDNMAIVRTIIGLGTSLSLEVLAEGIETQAQRDFLAESGCIGGQGFLLSQPLSADDAQALLQVEADAAPDSPGVRT